MSNYPQSGSLISADKGAVDGTRSSGVHAGLSTQIIIKVQEFSVGAIQEITVNQNRTLKRYNEVGTDGVVEIIPTSPTAVNVSIRRIVFDGMSLPESFGRVFSNIQAQRIPFNIDLYQTQYAEDVFEATPGITTPNIDIGPSVRRRTGMPLVKRIHNCWFARLSTPYNANNFIISETAEIQAEYITTFMPALSQSLRQPWAQGAAVDTIEREIDTTGRRASLSSVSLEPKNKTYGSSIADIGRRFSEIGK